MLKYILIFMLETDLKERVATSFQKVFRITQDTMELLKTPEVRTLKVTKKYYNLIIGKFFKFRNYKDILSLFGNLWLTKNSFG